MRKVAFILLFVTIKVFLISGQTPLDTLYLKNGSVVFGRMWEEKADKYILKTTDGMHFIFAKDEVERFVSREKYLPSEKRPEGLGFTIQSGLHIGSPDESFILLPAVNVMLSYTFNPFSTLSIGSGAEFFDRLMIPLFLDYKINLVRNRLTPFYYAKAGVLFNGAQDTEYEYYSEDSKPGWTAATGLGLSWPMSRFDSWMQIGYRYAFSKSTIYEGYYRTKIYRFNRFEVAWGFKF